MEEPTWRVKAGHAANPGCLWASVLVYIPWKKSVWRKSPKDSMGNAAGTITAEVLATAWELVLRRAAVK